MTDLPKFESQLGDDWSPHQYPRVFVRERTKRSTRLKIGASNKGVQTMLQLASVLREPFAILYVLVVPRGESADGRYQSPWMSRPELSAMLGDFERFLDHDARHHIWLRSEPDQATLIYDRHNVIFAYGPLEDYIRILASAGYSEAAELQSPVPHRHQYHPTFDADELRLISLPGWERSPLRQGDEE